jgi:argininosuccinate lyase
MARSQGFPTQGPAPELVAAGFAYETEGAATLHDGLNLADLAHVLDLLDRGLVPREAAVALLRAVLDADSMDAIGYDPADGEPYNSRERAFAARLGLRAGWLHAGRPRREATRVAFRLHLRRATTRVAAATARLALALADRADEHRATVFPDQTYLQHAQPSTVGHYLLSFAYPVLRDGRRLVDVVGWLNRSPAGAGCVNGTRLQRDRGVAARCGRSTASSSSCRRSPASR